MRDEGSRGTHAVTEHDRRRLRATWRTAAAGPILGVLAAAGTAAVGLSGRAGLAAVLLLSSFGLVAAALVTVLHALIDEWARRPVARRRVFVALGLFLGSAVLLVLLGGVSSA